MSKSLMETLLASAVSIPKGTSGIGTLPVGYLADPDSPDTSELWTDVEVREMDGRDEDMLGAGNIAAHKKLGELLRRCLVALGPERDPAVLARVVGKLTVTDRLFTLFLLRRTTLGDTYPFEATCPNDACRDEKGRPTVGVHSVDLSSAEIRPAFDPRQRVHTVTLPSGKEAVFHMMTGNDEERVARYVEDRVTMKHAARLDSLEGRKFPTDPNRVDPQVVALIQGLAFADRDFLSSAYELAEGGVDTEVELKCAACGYTFRQEMDIQRGFFSRSGTRRPSKTKSS